MSNKALVLSRINDKLANAPAPQTINEAIQTALDALLELKDEQRKREEEEARKRNAADNRKKYLIRVSRTDEAYVLVKAPNGEIAEEFVDNLLEGDDPHTKFDYSGVCLEIDRDATTVIEDEESVPDYEITTASLP